MTKKIFFRFYLLLTVGMTTIAFNSYGKEDEPKEEKNQNNQSNSLTTDAGVVINGVKWATRNVNVPGKFTATPTDFGMFYQWNRKIGWTSSDPMLGSNGNTKWDKTTPKGTTWEKSNDPSPSGWRIPTFDEVEKLMDTNKVTNKWITENGITGCKFTDKTSNKSIFLPAAGNRIDSDGTLSDMGLSGYYSSSTSNMDYEAYIYIT